MNNPNVKFISKEKLLNSPEIYHKVNSSKTADEGCNNKWKQSLFQLFFEITKKDNDNLSFLQPPGKFRYQCPPYFCNIFINTSCTPPNIEPFLHIYQLCKILGNSFELQIQ